MSAVIRVSEGKTCPDEFKMRILGRDIVYDVIAGSGTLFALRCPKDETISSPPRIRKSLLKKEIVDEVLFTADDMEAGMQFFLEILREERAKKKI